MNQFTPWHALDQQQALARLDTSDTGLTREEASRRLQQYGANVIPEPAPKSLLAVYLNQFRNAFIYLLLLAAAVSLFLGEIGDALFIAVALQINAVIGTIQEWQAQTRALGLKNLVKSMVAVSRGGCWEQIPGAELVPGDVVEVEAGTQVPASLRLLTDEALEVDESLLTGESTPIAKFSGNVLPEKTALADRSNMLHAGTTVMRGKARAVVAETGLRTEVGKVAQSLKLRDEVKPPLIRRMEKFTHVVAGLMAGIIGLIAFAEFMQGVPPSEILLTSVALAVAAIPEGLPVALTVALAISVSRMAKRDVVVRRLAAVEGLGACTMIASDKTGTLTMNELTVQRVWLPTAGELEISALLDETAANGNREAFARLLAAGVLCNEARLETRADGSQQVFGDTVDGAFLKLARLAGLVPDKLLVEFPRAGRIPYEPALAFAASFHHHGSEVHAWVKGAAEVLLPFCRDEVASQVHQQVDLLAGKGYRVLALATGKVGGCEKDKLHDLELLGLVALIDPLRPAALAAVRSCAGAGVAVRMITGDHPLTALEIGRQLGIADRESDVVTGSRLAELEQDRTAFDAIVARSRIFARIAPLQKLAIVQSMQRAGHAVAVTGDGVNDVSALAVADIGAAMGHSGTDIARSAADLLLVNDDLSSLVNGIEEGRIAYDNIRKVIYLLISTGAAELVLFMVSIAAGLPLPLTAVQLLWLNLVTQGIQDVALAFEKGEPDVLERKPRPPREGIFNRQMIQQVVLSGLVVGGVSFFVYQWLLASGMGQFAASNQLLLVLILFENAHVFNCRSETRSAFQVPIGNNPFLVFGVIAVQLIHLAAMNIPGISTVLDLAQVDLGTWLLSALPAVFIVVVMETYKLWLRAYGAKP